MSRPLRALYPVQNHGIVSCPRPMTRVYSTSQGYVTHILQHTLKKACHVLRDTHPRYLCQCCLSMLRTSPGTVLVQVVACRHGLKNLSVWACGVGPIHAPSVASFEDFKRSPPPLKAGIVDTAAFRLGLGSPSWWNQSWFYNPF